MSKTIKVRIDDLIQQLTLEYGSTNIPKDIIDLYAEFGFDNELVDVRASIFDECASNKHDDELHKHEYAETSRLRLCGMEKEKRGDMDGAIRDYIHCIEVGEAATHPMFNAYAHAYKRLITCLHKSKDYGNEIHYLQLYLQHSQLSDDERNKYKARLNKLQSK